MVEEVEALYAALEKPQPDFSEEFQEFVNSAMEDRDGRLNIYSISDALDLYFYLFEKIKSL